MDLCLLLSTFPPPAPSQREEDMYQFAQTLAWGSATLSSLLNGASASSTLATVSAHSVPEDRLGARGATAAAAIDSGRAHQTEEGRGGSRDAFQRVLDGLLSVGLMSAGTASVGEGRGPAERGRSGGGGGGSLPLLRSQAREGCDAFLSDGTALIGLAALLARRDYVEGAECPPSSPPEASHHHHHHSLYYYGTALPTAVVRESLHQIAAAATSTFPPHHSHEASARAPSPRHQPPAARSRAGRAFAPASVREVGRGASPPPSVVRGGVRGGRGGGAVSVSVGGRSTTSIHKSATATAAPPRFVVGLQALQAEVARLLGGGGGDGGAVPLPSLPTAAIASSVYSGNIDAIALVLHVLFLQYVVGGRSDRASQMGSMLTWFEALGEGGYGLPMLATAVRAVAGRRVTPSPYSYPAASVTAPPPPSPAAVASVMRLFGDCTLWLLALANHQSMRGLFQRFDSTSTITAATVSGCGGAGGSSSVHPPPISPEQCGMPSPSSPLDLSQVYLCPRRGGGGGGGSAGAGEGHGAASGGSGDHSLPCTMLLHNVRLFRAECRRLGIHNYFDLSPPLPQLSSSSTSTAAHNDDFSCQPFGGDFLATHPNPLFVFLQSFLIFNFVSNCNRLLVNGVGGRRIVNEVIVQRMLLCGGGGGGGGGEGTDGRGGGGFSADYVDNHHDADSRRQKGVVADDEASDTPLPARRSDLYYFNEGIYPQLPSAACSLRLPVAAAAARVPPPPPPLPAAALPQGNTIAPAVVAAWDNRRATASSVATATTSGVPRAWNEGGGQGIGERDPPPPPTDLGQYLPKAHIGHATPTVADRHSRDLSPSCTATGMRGMDSTDGGGGRAGLEGSSTRRARASVGSSPHAARIGAPPPPLTSVPSALHDGRDGRSSDSDLLTLTVIDMDTDEDDDGGGGDYADEDGAVTVAEPAVVVVTEDSDTAGGGFRVWTLRADANSSSGSEDERGTMTVTGRGNRGYAAEEGGRAVVYDIITGSTGRDAPQQAPHHHDDHRYRGYVDNGAAAAGSAWLRDDGRCREGGGTVGGGGGGCYPHGASAHHADLCRRHPSIRHVAPLVVVPAAVGHSGSGGGRTVHDRVAARLSESRKVAATSRSGLRSW